MVKQTAIPPVPQAVSGQIRRICFTLLYLVLTLAPPAIVAQS